jgi:EmrB/QacA subfamily drug resistance transporter
LMAGLLETHVEGRVSNDRAHGLFSGRRWGVLAVLCLSVLVVELDNTILSVALPQLTMALRASLSDLQWIVDAYPLVFAGLVITAGSVADLIGRKRILLLGLLLFGAASALSAFSGTPAELIGWRVAMGLGGAMILPTTLAVINDVFRGNSERARAIAVWSATSGLGVALGPTLGGWLLSHFWWGSVFLVNAPVAAAGVLGAALMVPESRDPTPRRPDLVGSVLSTAGMAGLVYGIVEAPDKGLQDPAVYATAIGGLATIAAFCAWEARAVDPMLPMRLFEDRRFVGGTLSVALAFFSLFGVLFILGQYMQFVLGYSVVGTGLRIAPVSIALAVCAPVSTVVVRWLSRRWAVALGLGLVAGGVAAFARLGPHSAYGELLVALSLMGAGLGLALAPAMDAVIEALPAARAGVGSGVNSTVIQLGGSIGVAVLGSLINGVYRARMSSLLSGRLFPRGLREAVVSSLGGAIGVARGVGGHAGDQLAQAARAAFVEGMQRANRVGLVFVLAGAISALVLLDGFRKRRHG